MILVAFGAALASGFAGISPGTIFNSIMVQLDMHPSVASATGMYCTLFTTLAASTILLFNSALNMPYAALICIVTLIGTFPGLYGQTWLVKKAGGRIQFTVLILFCFLILPIVSVLPLSLIDTKRASDNGADVGAFTPFCD